MKQVFVDTSGLYAALDRSDPFHANARDAFDRAGTEQWTLFTTSYVVLETWSLVQRRLGWNAVDELADGLLPACQVIWVDQTLHALGIVRCRQARERRLSLTDCVSLEWMRQNQISQAIAQDEHFAREGISMP